MSFGAVGRLDRPAVEGVAEVVALLARKRQGHRVRVDVDAYDGDDSSKNLLLGFVWDGQLIPEAEKEGLVAGEARRVWFVEEEVILPVETGGIISVGC